MKYLQILLFLGYAAVLAQPVVTVPQFASQSDSIKIIFDATQGDGGLAGYTGTVYAHTGVITNNSTSGTDWKHVIGTWGNNSTQPALTRIGSDLYELVLGFPREFYSLTDPSEQILKLAMVLRSSNASQTGRDVGGADILVDLFDIGISIVVVEPLVTVSFGDPRRSPVFAEIGDTVPVRLNAAALGTAVAALSLELNGIQVAQTSADTLSYFFTATGSGFASFQAIATDTNGFADTSAFEILVRDLPLAAAPPAGTVPGINYTGSSSVTLALFAPGKEFVYVLGDFNDWLVDNAWYMNKYQVSADSVLWWLNVNNLTAQQEYAFQYLVDGDIRIADPYTEKVLDPWNDSFIPAVTYPDLKPYPANKTAEPVGIIQTGQTPYNWQSSGYQRPAQQELVIYELLIRDFIARHDYETLIDTLDYLQDLGINAIELMPFNEFEGNNSWGYNPSFMFAVDKYYGTAEKLKSFIDECHNRGIAVIMDIVLNHNYGQSPLVRMYWDAANGRPAADSPWFNQTSPNPVFSFGYDFDHESVHTKALVDRVNSYWLREFKVDGFRFDFTKGFTNTPGDGGARDPARIAILKRMADEIWLVDGDAYVILEHFADNSEEIELANYGMMLWGNSNFNYNEATMGYNGNSGSDFSWGYYKTRGWNVRHLVTYMESHDEERLMYKNLQFGNSNSSYNVRDLNTALNRQKMAGAFFFTLPGPKLIWQFGELAYDISINFNGRVGEKPIRWDYYSDGERRKLYKTWQALLKLRSENPTFSSQISQVNLWLNDPEGRKRIAIDHPTMDAVIIGNFGIVPQPVEGEFGRNGFWYDYFSGDSIEVSSVNQPILLAPGQFMILTSNRLAPPEADLLTGIEQLSEALPSEFKLKQNYPNPFNPATTLEFDVSQAVRVELAVYNLLGQKVRGLLDEELQPGTWRSVWDGRNDSGREVSSGIYFLSMRAGGFVQSRRMVLLR